MLTLSRAKGLDIRPPFGLVEEELLRVLSEERLIQFSMLKYLVSASNLPASEIQKESSQNFELLFPWVSIDIQEKNKKDEARLLALRDKLLTE